MPALPTARVVHTSPGRLRLRVDDRRRDAAYFAAAAAGLATCPGVDAVEGNALTASLLVLHDTDERVILDHANTAGLFAVEPPSAASVSAMPPLPASDRWMADLALANRRFSEAAEGRGDLGTLLAGFFILVAAVQAARGRIAMPALSALWYAMRALSLTRQWRPDR